MNYLVVACAIQDSGTFEKIWVSPITSILIRNSQMKIVKKNCQQIHIGEIETRITYFELSPGWGPSYLEHI